MAKSELIISSRGNRFECAVEEGITWETHRKGTSGKLTFNVIKDDKISFFEGDVVQFNYDGHKVFYGYVFTKKRTNNRIITVTAYDQLRYFKNKETYSAEEYKDKTASQVFEMIAKDFNLKLGKVDNTKYVIPSRTEDNQELFTIIDNALGETTKNTGELYVYYDDYGSLCLQNVKNLKTDILIDEETGESFEYTTSIDENTYNKIKLVRENKEKNERDVFIADDKATIDEWGVLQFYETINDNVNGQKKADDLLKLYNRKTRKLHINKVCGDVRVRGGSLIGVKMNLGDLITSNFMMVESVKHTFSESDHRMDLKLIGGDFGA